MRYASPKLWCLLGLGILTSAQPLLALEGENLMFALRRPFPLAALPLASLSWLCTWALAGVGCSSRLVPAAADGGGTAEPCSGSPVACARGCTKRESQVQICRNGEWACPDGLATISDCPPDSCAKSYVNCCDPATGAIEPARCGADDRYEPCPGETRALGPVYECFPPDAGVTSCSQLVGSCASAALRCSSDSPTFFGSRYCECQNISGALMWSCGQVLE